MYFYGINEWEMYDLETDPNEMKNIYGQAVHAATEAMLKSELKKLVSQYRDSTSIQF